MATGVRIELFSKLHELHINMHQPRHQLYSYQQMRKFSAFLPHNSALLFLLLPHEHKPINFYQKNSNGRGKKKSPEH